MPTRYSYGPPRGIATQNLDDKRLIIRSAVRRRSVSTRVNRAVTGSSSIVVQNYTPRSPDGMTVPFNASNQWSGAGNPAGYDGAGNMTALQTMTMTYDPESRLTSWSDSRCSTHARRYCSAIWRWHAPTEVFAIYSGD